MSDNARRNASSSSAQLGVVPTNDEMQHEEHMITDGRDMREVSLAAGREVFGRVGLTDCVMFQTRHLQQDNEIVHYVTERMAFSILQILGKCCAA